MEGMNTRKMNNAVLSLVTATQLNCNSISSLTTDLKFETHGQ